MNIIELFAGVGGFRVGFERCDKDYFKTVFFSQWEPGKKKQFAYHCYNHNFDINDIDENLRQYTNMDIAEVPKDKLPDCDLLVGGFPCQDYSVAHSLVTSKGIEGKKGVLWWQIRSTIEKKQPKFVLLENVDRLLKSPSKQRGRDFGIILYCLDELGYDVEWCVINAAEQGEPQKRRRVFIFAWNRNTTRYAQEKGKMFFDDFTGLLPYDSKHLDLREYSFKEINEEFVYNFHKWGKMEDGKIETSDYKKISSTTITLGEIMEHTDNEKYYNFKYDKFVELKGAKKKERTTKEGYTYTFSEGSCPFPDKLDVPARTLLTSEGTTNRSTHVVNDNGRLRLLTPLECERIQTFPDNWTKYGINEDGVTYELSDRERYFLMGNALVTNLITKMGQRLKEINEREV